MKRIFFHILFLFFAAGEIVAQINAQALIKMDTNRIRIGEQTRLEIILSYDKNEVRKRVVFPEIDDTISKQIEVVGKSNIEAYNTKTSSNTLQFRQFITITSFDSGYWVIPPFKFFTEGDTIPFTETNPLLLEVKTVPVDTAETSVRDIKPIFEEQWNWKELLPYIYWGLGILAILGVVIYLSIYFNNKRKKKPVVAIEKPKEPPHITALRELELIRQNKIWAEGNYKDYYTSITDVLRNYIEGRFKIHAMELTTDEILQIFRTQVIDPESKAKLKQVLELADFVKFAKVIPIEAENEITLASAYDFVNGTKREEVVVTAPSQNGTPKIETEEKRK